MASILSNRSYRHLLGAQLVALFGTGLATVALGLLAFDLAGENAALVLGLVFTVKMVAYVALAPIAGAFANHWPRRRMLVTLDLIRAAVAICLPFVSEIWQIFVLIFILQAASAAFTPTFQATIPDLLPDERDYTKALSFSRLAYDLESLLSPLFAGVLLIFVSYNTLFWGTVVGFIGSALLVGSVMLPKPAPSPRRKIWDRTTRGIRIYLATPRLRGLLGLSLAVSSAGAMVIVNTVVLVQGEFGFDQAHVAWALACFGGGSMIMAICLPRLLENLPDRPVMLWGGAALSGILFALAAFAIWGAFSWANMLAGWFALGLAYSAVLTPSGRLLRRSAHQEDLPTVFAAQFALSHACWLLTYPLSGWLQTQFGTITALLVLALLALIGLIFARRCWPAGTSETLEHTHPELPANHPHLQGEGPHAHAVIIDDLHPVWPRSL